MEGYRAFPFFFVAPYPSPGFLIYSQATSGMRGLLTESPHRPSRSSNYRLNVASECDSATITCPVLSPSGLLGAVTNRRIARTVSPA